MDIISNAAGSFLNFGNGPDKLDARSNFSGMDTASLNGKGDQRPSGFQGQLQRQGSVSRTGSRRGSPRSSSRTLDVYADEPTSARLQDNIQKTKNTIRTQEEEIAMLKRQLSTYGN
jgi:hypothetical protein